jgi:transcriptional regulator with GAF, ATPase, and Fis domain
MGKGVQAELDVLTPDHGATPAALERALIAAGVELKRERARREAHPLIVAFSQLNDGLLRRLDDAHARGVRVLLVALAPAANPAAHWQLLRRGAADVVTWTVPEPTARSIVDRLVRWHDIDQLMRSPLVTENLVGGSVAWMRALRAVAEAARYSAAPLLLTGETGTGKELAARLVHAVSGVRGELVLVDCTTVARELAGSELFGHERGAFTGAASAREGACRLADGGTLFLDEIGELPMAIQAELLRVVQEGMYKPVGSNRWCRASFRLVCATHRDLWLGVEQRTFRQDLYFRIAGLTCALPPLRDRVGDVVPLAEHFVRVERPELAAEGPVMVEAVRTFLESRDYPGNVRELRQLVGRILTRHPGNGPITAGDVPPDEWPAAPVGALRTPGPVDFDAAVRAALAHGLGLKEIGREATETAIRIAAEGESSLAAAARKLGVSGRALQLRRASRRDP